MVSCYPIYPLVKEIVGFHPSSHNFQQKSHLSHPPFHALFHSFSHSSIYFHILFVGGSVGVRSVEGQGSTFYATFTFLMYDDEEDENEEHEEDLQLDRGEDQDVLSMMRSSVRCEGKSTEDHDHVGKGHGHASTMEIRAASVSTIERSFRSLSARHLLQALPRSTSAGGIVFNGSVAANNGGDSAGIGGGIVDGGGGGSSVGHQGYHTTLLATTTSQPQPLQLSQSSLHQLQQQKRMLESSSLSPRPSHLSPLVSSPPMMPTVTATTDDEPANNTSFRVLVVDDVEMNRKMLRSLLQKVKLR